MSSTLIRQQLYVKYFNSTTNLCQEFLFDNKFISSTFIRQQIHIECLYSTSNLYRVLKQIYAKVIH